MADECCCSSTTTKPKLKLRVINPNHRFGCHVSLRSTLLETVSHPSTKPCRCLQFFLGNPQSLACRTLSQSDKENMKEYCQKNHVSCYSHLPYLANLAKPDANPSMQLIQKELVQLEGVPCSCVLHIGKVGTLETVCQHLNDLHITRSEFERSPYPLLMECSAGQGTELGKNWPELRKLFEGIDTNKIGLCMDTQHAFAAGLSDFGSHESVVKFFEEAESIAPGGVSLIHLNDSKVEFGRRVDRHANIGQGHIWSGKEKEEGLQSLIQYCFEKGIDMILETPNEGVESDLSILRSLDM